MRRLISAIAAAVSVFSMHVAVAEDALAFDQPDPVIDAQVRSCLKQEGIAFLPDTDVICYNAAIFPEQYLKLNELGPASRIIITSPGGNVATARGMSGILDKRSEPVTIAGPCMSACAMVILPGLDDVHIHGTAHIAVHGIATMPFRRWYGWLDNDKQPSSFAILQAQSGYNFPFMAHQAITSHMRQHLTDQGVDIGYVKDISATMEADARAFTRCRLKPDQYWGIVSPEHARKYLGGRVTKMEKFVGSWDDPLNRFYTHIGTPIGERTYIMQNDFDAAGCTVPE